MSNINSYFIPDTYKCQTECIKEGFWTPERVAREPFNGSYNVFRWIARTEKGLPGASLLDIGCGPASKLPLFFPDTILTGIDTDEAINLATRNVPGGRFIACDLDDSRQIDSLASELGTFKYITCIDVIEHILYPINILKLIYKCLESDGIAYIGTLDRDLSRGKDSVKYGSPKKEHVREWNKTEFSNFVHSAGFKILELKITQQAARPTKLDKDLYVQTLRCVKC